MKEANVVKKLNHDDRLRNKEVFAAHSFTAHYLPKTIIGIICSFRNVSDILVQYRQQGKDIMCLNALLARILKCLFDVAKL